jgi:predicted secreted Zn-dependent protease
MLAVASLGLLLVLAAGSPALARADSFRVENFAIHGTSARELRADLARLGPVGETGIRGDAYTEYRIAWKFSMMFKDGHCRASNVMVDLDVTMRLPSWVPPAGVAAPLITTWERFSEVLREHENGHYRIAISAASDVRRKLRARSRAATCELLKAKLNDTANAVLHEYREKQLDYDRDTDYGRAQGTGVL